MLILNQFSARVPSLLWSNLSRGRLFRITDKTMLRLTMTVRQISVCSDKKNEWDHHLPVNCSVSFKRNSNWRFYHFKYFGRVIFHLVKVHFIPNLHWGWCMAEFAEAHLIYLGHFLCHLLNDQILSLFSCLLVSRQYYVSPPSPTNKMVTYCQ